MKAALTEKEWRILEFRPSYWGDVSKTENELFVRCPDNREIFTPSDQHKLAALCLHNQEFGFTREHATAIRWCVKGYRANPTFQREADILDGLADLIEALLPPEDKHA